MCCIATKSLHNFTVDSRSCQLNESRVLWTALFIFCGVNTIFRVEFVNKQIKVKDHIKRRYAVYCTYAICSVNVHRNMPHGNTMMTFSTENKLLHISTVCFCFPPSKFFAHTHTHTHNHTSISSGICLMRKREIHTYAVLDD